jgi:DNA-binding NtrC family response regulator
VYKILVIDDDESTRESLFTYLEDIGYDVREADNGLKALEIIKNYFPDLIISDIKMQGLTGIELAYIIKGLKINIPVILVSCYENSEIRFAESYYFSYLPKPLNIKDLRRNISKALRKAA